MPRPYVMAPTLPADQPAPVRQPARRPPPQPASTGAATPATGVPTMSRPLPVPIISPTSTASKRRSRTPVGRRFEVITAVVVVLALNGAAVALALNASGRGWTGPDVTSAARPVAPPTAPGGDTGQSAPGNPRPGPSAAEPAPADPGTGNAGGAGDTGGDPDSGGRQSSRPAPAPVQPDRPSSPDGQGQPDQPARPDPASRQASSRIEAESWNRQVGTGTQTAADLGGGLLVGPAANGDWLRFDNVDFSRSPATQFIARAASGAPAGISGLVEVRLDSLSSNPVGSFAIASTGGWQSWRTVPANMAPVSGVHTVYLTFTSGQPREFVNLNWVTFGR